MNEQLANIFRQYPGEFVSGEALGGLLGVSRVAVGKAVRQLMAAGYEIEARTKVGYRLISVPDKLYPCEIRPYLKTERIGREMVYRDTLDSTNVYAKSLAMQGASDGTVVIAEQQTAGRGRRGRTWMSDGTGAVTASILLRPPLSADRIAQTTLLAAQAVCTALREETGVSAQIKWPNDIVCSGKKLCGILTEVGTLEQEVDYMVVGFGINVNETPEQFGDLAGVATSLRMETGRTIDRKRVLAAVLNRFEQYYETYLQQGDIGFFLEDYKAGCINLGARLTLEYPDKRVPCVGQDIDGEGRLVVRQEDGTQLRVLFGEVSVRGIYSGEDGATE